MPRPKPTPLSPNATTFIYALLDPITREIRYIGKSDYPRERLRDHVCDSKCNKENNRKANWIRSLLKQGLKPEMEIIDEVSVLEWEAAEAAYILYHKEIGCSLVNTTPGGDGVERGKRLSPEHRIKLVASQRRRRKLEAQIFTVNGAVGSLTELCEYFKKSQQERHRIKQRITQLGWSVEQAFAAPKGINGYLGGGGTFSGLSLEARAKISAAHLKNPSRYWLGKKMSEEARRNMGLAQLGRTASMETRMKISAATKGRYRGKRHSAESLANMRAAQAKKRKRIYTVLGITGFIDDLCKKFNVNKSTVASRLKGNWPPDQAFTAAKRKNQYA